MLLGLVCCTRLIRTLITVCSASFHLLPLEFDIRAATAAHPLEFEESRCRTSQFVRFYCRPRFECGMTFPTLCLAPERKTSSRVQSTTGCFPELCFLQFSVALVLVRLRKPTNKKLCFSRLGLRCWF